MDEDEVMPGPYVRRFAPEPLVAMGRALRRWQARGPRLSRYTPRSTLQLPDRTPAAACLPVIDFHTHLGRWLTPDGDWMEPDVRRLLDLMDSCNVASLVNLDGRWGRELEENLGRYDAAFPGRFYTFCQLDWRLLDQHRGPDLLVRSLEASVKSGARGVKIWKDLGLSVQVQGRRILPDDPILAPMWSAAGALGVPVVIHVADPVAFFQPADCFNERLEEMLRYRTRRGGGMAEFHRLIEALEHVVASHPETKVVAAHGYYPENVAYVSQMLDRYPNLHIDLGWTAHEFGRQPMSASTLFTRHSDRVLFGSDVFPLRASAYRTYFRLLETDDEAFHYSDDPVPGQGRWQIYGLNLPLSVLDRIYRQNACRLLGVSPPAARLHGRRDTLADSDSQLV